MSSGDQFGVSPDNPADCNTKQADASNGTSPDKRAHSTHTPPDESQLNGHNIYTETGDSTNRGTTGDGNRNTSMKYMLDRIKDEALNCIANHELDQLMNAYQVSPPAGDDGFGQSDPNNQLIFEVDHNPEILLAIDNATMQPSEQVWMGNAKFTIAVNGQQLGGQTTSLADTSDSFQTTSELAGDRSSDIDPVALMFINGSIGRLADEEEEFWISYFGVT